MGTAGRVGQGSVPSGPRENQIPEPAAGFWVRTAAFLVDTSLLLSILAAVLVLVLLSPLKDQFLHTTDPALLFSPPVVLVAGLGILAAFLYFSLGDSSPDQGTVGKKVLGLRVTDRDGAAIPRPRAAARFLAKILSFAAFFSGVVMIGVTREKRGLHDRLTDTLVQEIPVGYPRVRLGIGLAAAAASGILFLVVLALTITLAWYGVR